MRYWPLAALLSMAAVGAASSGMAQSLDLRRLALASGPPPVDGPYAVLLLTESGANNAEVCQELNRYSASSGLPVYWFGKDAFSRTSCRKLTDPAAIDFDEFYRFADSNKVLRQLRLRGSGPYFVVVQRGQPDNCLRNLGSLDLTGVPSARLRETFDRFDDYVLDVAPSRWREGADIHAPTLGDFPGWVGKRVLGVYKVITRRGCRPVAQAGQPASR